MMTERKLPYGLPMPGGPVDRPTALPEQPGFGAPADPNAPQPPFPAPDCPLRAQYTVDRDGLQTIDTFDAEITGSITASRGERLNMDCDKPCINGIVVKDDCRFTLADSEICFNGDGINDFIGRGAVVQAGDTACVTLKNTTIRTAGVIRPCTFVGDYATLVVRNCELIGDGGYLPEDAPQVIGPGMNRPPEGLGIGGNCRTHLSVGDSHSYFFDSKIVAEGWAALSVDACWGDLYLEANRCQITVRGSGYATYSDHGANVVLRHCTVRAEIGAILAGKTRERMSDCRVECGRHLAMLHSVFGNTHEIGELTVTGGSVSTEAECVLVKSQNAYLDFRRVKLTSRSGCLLRAVANDDPCATKVEPGEEVYGVKAVFSDMTVSGDVCCEDPDRTLALTLKHAQLTGGLKDVCLCLDPASCWTADRDSTVFLTAYGPMGKVDAKAGVTIHAHSDVLEPCRQELPSGGWLIVS